MQSLKAAVALSILFLAGCNTTENGLTTGATQGTVEGSQFAGGPPEAEVGAIQGGLLGADIGLSLDERDRKKALQAEYEALEYGRAGQLTYWRGRNSDTHGEIVVGALYQVNLLECREFKHTAYIEGRARVARGTACRQPSGNWRVVG